MLQSNLKKIIDYIHPFTGRKWVFQIIYNWFVDPVKSPYFLLTGEPGSGKTTIAARLTQFSQSETPLHPNFAPGFLSAVHFCSARDSTSIDPKNFARSIALQLAQIIPEYAKALKDIGEKSVNIQVEIEVETAEGNTTIQGVVIKNLSVAGLTGQEAFNRAVLDPLTTLYNQGFDRPITILVDSLDEALTHSGDATIVDLLSKLPSQIKARWILTSRQEPRVENAFVLEAVDGLFLSAPEFNQNNRQDIQSYIEKRLTQESSLATQVAGLNPSQQTDQIAQITNKSDGNFQYVSFLLDAIANGKRSFTNLEGLPEGLDGLYYDSLQRVVDLGKKDWSTIYAPVLGVLSVAQESLLLSQIQAFTSHSDQTLWACLNDLQQFLDATTANSNQDDDESQYRFYHQSVVDFLHKRSLTIEQKKLNNLYYLSPSAWHQQIADYYWNRYHLNWSQCNRYGLKYIATHLAEAAQGRERHSQVERLVKLVLNPDFQTIHQSRLKDLVTLQQDLERALQVAAVDSDPQTLSLLVEMALGLLSFRKQWFRPEPIFELARQGEIGAAERRLALFEAEAEWHQAALLTIAWFAAESNTDQAKQLRDRVIANLSEDKALPMLLQRLNSDLDKTQLPDFLLHTASPINLVEDIQNIFQKINLRIATQEFLINPTFRFDLLELLCTHYPQFADQLRKDRRLDQIFMTSKDPRACLYQIALLIAAYQSLSIPPNKIPTNQPNKIPTDQEVRAVIERIGGGADQELLASMLTQPLLEPRLMAMSMEQPMDDMAPVYISEQDGLLLIAYATAHPQEGREYLQKYIDLHTSYHYRRYRNCSLLVLMQSVLKYPDQKWTREMVSKIVSTALAGSNQEFQQSLPLTIIGLQALAKQPDALQKIQDYTESVQSTLESLPDDPLSGIDSWGVYRRRLASLAQIHAQLPDHQETAISLLGLAQSHKLEGFAGFQTLAYLTLAEANYICYGSVHPSIEVCLERAIAAAHNIQDGKFCAKLTARCNAMQQRWWQSSVADIRSTILLLCDHPNSSEFTALHRVGEDYRYRNKGPNKLPLPDWLRQAQTFADIARVYQISATELQHVNREHSWGVDEPLASGTWVNIPDPGFVTLLTTRLAAEVLVTPNLSDPERVELIQPLVPLAADNPTVLDTVLACLLLAARPTDEQMLSELSEIVKRYLSEEVANLLTPINHHN